MMRERIVVGEKLTKVMGKRKLIMTYTGIGIFDLVLRDLGSD